MEGQENKKPGVMRGRPDEIKLPLGLRIYPSDRALIEAKYNKIQNFFDVVVQKELDQIKLEGIIAEPLKALPDLDIPPYNSQD